MEVRGRQIRTIRGCGTTVQPRLTMCSTVFKLVWGLALSCCKRKVFFFSGLPLEIRAFSLVSVVMERSELMVFPGSRKFRRITPFLSQKTVRIALPAEGNVLELFLRWGIHVSNPWTAILTPAHNGDTTSRHR